MKINSAEDFGSAIKRKRKMLGYTQVYLSDATGLSTTFISDVEKGKVTCELGKCIRLANLLALDVNVTSRS